MCEQRVSFRGIRGLEKLSRVGPDRAGLAARLARKIHFLITGRSSTPPLIFQSCLKTARPARLVIFKVYRSPARSDPA